MTEKLTKIIDDVDTELSVLAVQLRLAERILYMTEGKEHLDKMRIEELEAFVDGLMKLVAHIREPLQEYCQ